MTSCRIAVLSGGSGTRLWPLSRESLPKQFHDLAGTGRPLLIDTLSRLNGLGHVTVITTESLRFSTMGFINQAGLKADVIGEPAPRNTAPAVLLAATLACRENPATVVGVFPADHTIANSALFHQVLEKGFAEAAKGAVVTLGIRPNHPATAYGYLDLDGATNGDGIQPVRVKRFVEKPSFEKAEHLLSTGRVAWNAGIFLFRADVMKGLFEKHMPEMAASFARLKTDLSNLTEIYAEVKSESVDFAIMEKLDSLLCIPADIGWSDVGSWEEVIKHSQTQGRPVEVNGSGNFYTGLVPSTKRVAFVGVSDLMTVDTPDALLIARKGFGQDVKLAVDALKKDNAPSVKSHHFEERPWGRFEVLVDAEHFKSKKITVLPGQKLSYQSHAKRAEHWVVVKGVAEVTLNDVQHRLHVGEHIHIPLGAKHRMSNPGIEPLEFIEVQTGSYFGEDDIVRYSDIYGRTC